MSSLIEKYKKLKICGDMKSKILIEIANELCPQKKRIKLEKKQVKLSSHKENDTFKIKSNIFN